MSCEFVAMWASGRESFGDFAGAGAAGGGGGSHGGGGGFMANASQDPGAGADKKVITIIRSFRCLISLRTLVSN